MIHVERILKQSWHILWNYRILWIFGLLLAMTTGGAGSGSNWNFRGGNNNSAQPQSSMPFPNWEHDASNWAQQNIAPLFEHPEQHISTFVLIGLGLLLFFIVIGLLVALVRYPAETAVIRMVDEYEQSGTKLRFGAGWKLGWNRRAFRLWVIDLIIGIPVFLFLAAMIGLGVAVYFSATSGNRAAALAGSLSAIVVFFLILIVFIALMVVLGLLRNFFARAAALEGLEIGASLRKGWTLFRTQWKNAGLMWLVMIGIGLIFGLGMIVVFFLLIPVYLILLIPAALTAALPFALGFGITSIFAASPWTWIVGALLALPFFFTVLFAPLLLISGWFRVYEASVWTLTYREMAALAQPAAPVVVVPPAEPPAA